MASEIRLLYMSQRSIRRNYYILSLGEQIYTINREQLELRMV